MYPYIGGFGRGFGVGPRGYLGAGIGYPYQGFWGYPGCGWGYPGCGYGFGGYGGYGYGYVSGGLL